MKKENSPAYWFRVLIATVILAQLLLIGLISFSASTDKAPGSENFTAFLLLMMMAVGMIQAIVCAIIVTTKGRGQLFGLLAFMGFGFLLVVVGAAARETLHPLEAGITPLLWKYGVNTLGVLGFLIACQMMVSLKGLKTIKELLSTPQRID